MFLFFSVAKTSQDFLSHWDCDLFYTANLEKYLFVSRISKIWLNASWETPACSIPLSMEYLYWHSYLYSFFFKGAFQTDVLSYLDYND